MTAVLAIETSTPACSVALNLGERLISRYSEEPRSHTRLVMSMVDEVLKEAGIKARALNGLAVTLGLDHLLVCALVLPPFRDWHLVWSCLL